MIITNNSVSLNRDKSFEQNIAQDDRKSASELINIMFSEIKTNQHFTQYQEEVKIILKVFLLPLYFSVCSEFTW